MVSDSIVRGFGEGLVVWLTGLSGSGKTTIATEVIDELTASGTHAVLLDGDIVRQHLWKDLGFTRVEREENLWRLAAIASALAKTGLVVVVAAISPFRDLRDAIRRQEQRYLEVYVNAPVDVCEARDVKGLYLQARRGELPNFTGVSDPYEPPLNPDLECRTGEENIACSVTRVLNAIKNELERQQLVSRTGYL